MAVLNYSELIAWQKAVDLVCDVYCCSTGFPSDERFGLIAQLRRAVVSVPANIAEGQGRNSTAEFRHFLSIAHGSLREVETYFVIAERLGYLQNEVKTKLLDAAAEVGRLINGLSNSLQRRN